MAAGISPDRVGVLLSGAKGKAGSAERAEALAHFLEDWYPTIRIRVASSPLGDPEMLRAFVETYRLRALVLVPGANGTSPWLLQEYAEAAGLPPWAVHLVQPHGETPDPAQWPQAVERVKALCAAGVERALALEEVPPENLKPCYPTPESCLSRRALFRSLAGIRYRVIPQVNPPRCKGRHGCKRCLKACPLDAIALPNGHAVIDKARCDGCGICVKACPPGAIHYPVFAPNQIDGEMRGLLHPGVQLNPRVLALACREVAVPPVPGVLPLAIPCVGMASAFMILRAFDLGTDGVALVPGGKRCGRRHEFAHLAREVRTSQAALELFGIEKERVLLPPGIDTPAAVFPKLKVFWQRIQELGPSPLAALRPLQRDDHKWQLGPLLAGIARKARPKIPTSRELPLGILEVDAARCTLCGLCALPCPTEALRFTGGAGQAALTFDHATCVACALCLRACPEKALLLRRKLDPGRLQGPAILLEEPMARCRRCGVAFAPLKMCERIQGLLAKRGSPGPDYVMHLCPACRVVGGRPSTQQDPWAPKDSRAGNETVLRLPARESGTSEEGERGMP